MATRVLLKDGELPRTNEGFRANGQMLWVSLCRLYDKIMLASDEESCEIIINWCKNHVHPYYFYGDPYNAYDRHQKEDFPASISSPSRKRQCNSRDWAFALWHRPGLMLPCWSGALRGFRSTRPPFPTPQNLPNPSFLHVMVVRNLLQFLLWL